MVNRRRSQVGNLKGRKLMVPLVHPLSCRVDHHKAIAQVGFLLQQMGNQGKGLGASADDGNVGGRGHRWQVEGMGGWSYGLRFAVRGAGQSRRPYTVNHIPCSHSLQ